MKPDLYQHYEPVYAAFEDLPFEELNRKVTRREYERLLNYALELGIENGFFQEGEAAKESFIPDFNGEGV